MSTSETTEALSFKLTRQWPVLLIGTAVIWYLLYGQLQTIADWLTFTVLKLSPETHLAQSVNFFLYDVPKILMLLTGMIFAVTLIRSFFSPEQTRALLGGRREGLGNIFAAGLGVVTPFCSCSAVPLFIGFVESGIPLGVTFSFLVAAPMVNEVALAMLFGMFGWKIAGLYLVTGLLTAILSGLVIGRLKMERYVEDFVWQINRGQQGSGVVFKPAWNDRLRDAAQATREIVGRVWLYVVIGIAGGRGHPRLCAGGLPGRDYGPSSLVVGTGGRSHWHSTLF